MWLKLVGRNNTWKKQIDASYQLGFISWGNQTKILAWIKVSWLQSSGGTRFFFMISLLQWFSSSDANRLRYKRRCVQKISLPHKVCVELTVPKMKCCETSCFISVAAGIPTKVGHRHYGDQLGQLSTTCPCHTLDMNIPRPVGSNPLWILWALTEQQHCNK